MPPVPGCMLHRIWVGSGEVADDRNKEDGGSLWHMPFRRTAARSAKLASDMLINHTSVVLFGKFYL